MSENESPSEMMNVMLQMFSLYSLHSGSAIEAEELREQITLVTENNEQLSTFDAQVVTIDDEVCVQLVEKSVVDQLAKLAEERDES